MPAITKPLIPLESGDRLSREEFHRRYCARPDIKKAELVEGVVYVPSPVRHKFHGKQQGMLSGWLAVYAAGIPELEFGSDATVLLPGDNELQPDAYLFRGPPAGSAHINDEGYIEGAPELVAEVAASSASYDMHDKLAVYQRAGVREYIGWLVLKGRIRWLRLQDGAFVEIAPDEHGMIESAVFPGLLLDVPKMLAGDMAGVLAALKREAE